MSTTAIVLVLCLLFVLWPRRIRYDAAKGRPVVFGIAWLLLLAVAVVTTALSYVLAPKPKEGKPGSVDDLGAPTNDAGREMMVVFGEGTIKSPNILWFGDKGVRTYKVKA